MQAQTITEQILSFGSFDLYRTQRILLNEGRRVRIGGRALDILAALAERPGEVLSKKELMARAWPHTFVEESNLRVNIVALRKLLRDGATGDRSIVNVNGLGYMLAIAVARSWPAPNPPSAALSARLADDDEGLIGRDVVVEDITAHLTRHRLITVVGPAGVGKSAVAMAVHGAMRPGAHVMRLDISSIGDAALLPATLAAALAVPVLSQDPMGDLVAALGDRQLLIVLDNCEHIIDAVTGLVESLLRGASGVTILATSREPLLAGSEFVYRLQPLSVPTATHCLNAATAMAFPAVALFVKRATNGSDTFAFSDAEAPSIADICIRLDGLPLAIELIAARVDLFGIGDLATDLGERLMLGARGSRTAPPRQQSIRGALDWSHQLLSPTEKIVFRRFSVFRGPFSLEAAVAIVSDDILAIDDVLNAIAQLTAKSLLGPDMSGAKVRYRLLHITRIYAGEKLAESGEESILAHRHAAYFRALLSDAESQWERRTRIQRIDAHDDAPDDVRSALEWLSYELRVATNLCDLRVGPDRRGAARGSPDEIVARLTHGAGNSDVRRAPVFSRSLAG